jgi:hypothetical protein
MDQIRFAVSYGWGEYLSIARDFSLPEYNEDRRKKGKNTVTADDWRLRVAFALVLTPVYLYKVSRVGRCEFSIGEAEVVRVSKDGALQCRWSDVVEVKQLSQAYLVMKSDGGVPLPYRCFSTKQREEFDQLLARLGK